MRDGKSIPYEPHVDGLRTVAVLSVILFHLEKNWLPGGFIGVDIFFVISGYLITGIIRREIDLGRFSIAGFYRRRIKRILPLYLLILLASTSVGFIFLLPPDLERLTASGLSSMLFVSNLYFWKTSGYFTPDAETQPLLHMWSLSVEEQFYVLWPLVLLGLARLHILGTRRAFWFLGLLFAVLVVLSVVAVGRNASFAYFMLPTRAFELLAGAGVSQLAIARTGRSMGLWLSGAGGVLLLIGLTMINESTPYPGWAALAPTIGTALLIQGGRGNDNPVARLLSTAPFVETGLLSYSLYLWHWPVIAYAKYLNIELSAALIVGLLLLILLLSALTYRYVERPMIQATPGFRKAVFGFFVLPLLAYAGVYLVTWAQAGFYQRYDPAARQYIASMAGRTESLGKQCLGEHRAINQDESCLLNSRAGQPPRLALWGDSHADHFRPMTEKWLADAGMTGRELSFWGCPPVLDFLRQDVGFGALCQNYNTSVFDYLVAQGYTHVILAARWRGYLDPARAPGPNWATTEGSGFAPLLERTVRRLTEKSIKVILLESVPTYDFNPSECEIKNDVHPALPRRSCGLSVERFNADEAAARALLESIRGKYAGVEIIAWGDIFCPGGECLFRHGGDSLYRDKTHLSIAGSSFAGQQYLAKHGNPLRPEPSPASR